MSDKQHGAALNAIVPWDQVDALFTGEYLLQRIASLGPEDYHAVAEFLRENPDDTVPCPRCGKRTWRGLRCVHCT